MICVQQDFQERVDEIENYFSFIEHVDEGIIRLIKRDDSTDAYSSNKQGDIVRTFKASAFLLLYNLMESTVSNAIEAIFDEFENNSVSFDACRQEIRQVVLTNLKHHNPGDIITDLNTIATDIITKTFRKNRIFSGNVDAQRIREVANEYGFQAPSADGRPLLTVKSSRNNLAHGSKSFAEVGRDYSVADILRMKRQVITYLGLMLENVAIYIDQKHYLSAVG